MIRIKDGSLDSKSLEKDLKKRVGKENTSAFMYLLKKGFKQVVNKGDLTKGFTGKGTFTNKDGMTVELQWRKGGELTGFDIQEGISDSARIKDSDNSKIMNLLFEIERSQDNDTVEKVFRQMSKWCDNIDECYDDKSFDFTNAMWGVGSSTVVNYLNKILNISDSKQLKHNNMKRIKDEKEIVNRYYVYEGDSIAGEDFEYEDDAIDFAEELVERGAEDEVIVERRTYTTYEDGGMDDADTEEIWSSYEDYVYDSKRLKHDNMRRVKDSEFSAYFMGMDDRGRLTFFSPDLGAYFLSTERNKEGYIDKKRRLYEDQIYRKLVDLEHKADTNEERMYAFLKCEQDIFAYNGAVGGIALEYKGKNFDSEPQGGGYTTDWELIPFPESEIPEELQVGDSRINYPITSKRVSDSIKSKVSARKKISDALQKFFQKDLKNLQAYRRVTDSEGKIKENVVFLIEDSDVLAVFPNTYGTASRDKDTMTCYSHNGQHGVCTYDYANTLKTADSYNELKDELTNYVGYNLNIIDSLPAEDELKKNAKEIKDAYKRYKREAIADERLLARGEEIEYKGKRGTVQYALFHGQEPVVIRWQNESGSEEFEVPYNEVSSLKIHDNQAIADERLLARGEEIEYKGKRGTVQYALFHGQEPVVIRWQNEDGSEEFKIPYNEVTSLKIHDSEDSDVNVEETDTDVEDAEVTDNCGSKKKAKKKTADGVKRVKITKRPTKK